MTNKHNKYTKSVGQRDWDRGMPTLHRHHSGAGRKDTHNVNVAGVPSGLKSFSY